MRTSAQEFRLTKHEFAVVLEDCRQKRRALPQPKTMRDHICLPQSRTQTLPWLNLCSGLLNDLLENYDIAQSRPSTVPTTQKDIPSWSARRARMPKLELP